MSDAASWLARAGDALREGRVADCEPMAMKGLCLLRDTPPAPGEREAVLVQLTRLRRLAAAAQAGIGEAEQLVRELAAAAGALDHYDRGGRRRIDTRLSGPVRRF